jgi:sensor histidine kinase YesM
MYIKFSVDIHGRIMEYLISNVSFNVLLQNAIAAGEAGGCL